MFFRPFRLSLAPTVCPWDSKDDSTKDSTTDLYSFPGFSLVAADTKAQSHDDPNIPSAMLFLPGWEANGGW